MKITSRVEHGELDKDGGRETKWLSQLRMQKFALAERSKRQQGFLSLVNGNVSTVLSLDDKSTIRLDHFSATGSTVNHGSLTLLQGVLGFLVRGELNKGEGHVVRVAANLDPALAVLQELAVDSRFEGDIVLGFG